MRYLLFPGLVLLFSSCCRDLDEPVTLRLDEDSLAFHIDRDGDYFDTYDSARSRREMIDDLSERFLEKGNDVRLAGAQADYTLELRSFDFSESVSTTAVADPCDSVPPYDTLRYKVSTLTVSMRCVLHDHLHRRQEEIEASADDSETLKEGPGLLLMLFTDKDCYEYREKRIQFEGKLRRCVLRRIHKRSLCVIKGWQETS